MRSAQRGLLLGGLILFAGLAAEQDDDPRLSISAGGIYTFNGDTRAGMFFDYRKLSIGSDPTQELSVFLSNRISADWRLQGFVFTGFTDSGANWGAGLQAKRYLPSLR